MSAADPRPPQIEAADPVRSAWVSANAGAGKTRVLAERVARLLLEGAEPQRILCLTYTKAAAAEMQTRLFTLLGSWALADDGALGQRLADLEGRAEPETSTERLARARRLFAHALETPGGLRIQTIHAFCDAVLRRFPLEAGVSPRFEVIDARRSAEMLASLRAEMAAEAETGGGGAFDAVASRLNEDDLDGLIRAILARRHDFDAPDIDARLRALFGQASDATVEALAAEALAALDRDRLEAHAALLHRLGGQADRALAAAIDAALADWQANEALRAAGTLAGAMFTTTGTLRGKRGFPVNSVKAEDPGAEALTEFLRNWASRCRDRLAAAETAARARDLHAFAHALLGRYAQAKRTRALLDFDDLITRTEALLGESAMRDWVLYKLDAGIQHILVDEAQDTAPAQWRIVAGLAEAFWAEPGARRTLFVVGDEKQSIYSFQGAAPEAFETWRGHFRQRLDETRRSLASPDLITSFRSAPQILNFVDAVFAGEDHALTQTPAPVRHLAHRAGDAARVDLWPLIEPAEKQEPGPWYEPVDTPTPDSPAQRLAARLAGEIARMIAEDSLPPRGGGAPRPVTAGDILVLLRQRGPLDKALIRELKRMDVPVAGADRLQLAEALAVKDLLAAVKVALAPGDDLSLAALLRSPLCDVDEAELYALAHGREGSLAAALAGAADRHPREAALVADLQRQADYLRPYEFLERILVGHDGQARLLARLGPEAGEVIDALLAEALAHETQTVPTLAGFLAHVEQGGIEVAREQERAGAAVRLMTVHGAKGLEAPVVILPDTMRQPPGRRGPHLLPAVEDPGLVLWLAGRAGDDAVAAGARAAEDARQAAERQRLLYVALTRAEDWLILCGAGKPDDQDKDGRWYGALAAAMDRLCPRAVAGPAGEEIRRLGPHPDPAPEVAPTQTPRSAGAPDWLRPAAHEPRPSRPSPSALPEPGTTPDAQPASARGTEEALAHGRAVHLLLERLADRPPGARATLAGRLLSAAEPGLSAEGRAHALAEAEAVLAMPEAGWIFGPDSLAEAGLALDLPALAPRAMIGRVDRLVITPETVRVIDFKTDAAPPATPEEVAPAYRAQLGAYRAALGAVFPGREITAALVWTAAPRMMALPGAMLDRDLDDAVRAS